jgi:hypothetical protein
LSLADILEPLEIAGPAIDAIKQLPQRLVRHDLQLGVLDLGQLAADARGRSLGALGARDPWQVRVVVGAPYTSRYLVAR